MAALAALGSTMFAQSQEVSISTPAAPPVIGTLLRPFHLEKRQVTPARLTDSPRLESLLRSGNLYLSARDVIALVLENNLDIAVQRYGSLLGQEVRRRTEGGGYLRQTDTPLISGPQSVSLEGVTVGTSGVAGGVTSGGGIVSQIGPVPPNLDPNLVLSYQLGHQTTPQTNTILNQTSALTVDYRQVYFQYSQQFATGTSGALTYTSTRSLLNSPTTTLNPATSGYIDLVINQNLLQGFGLAVNKRDAEVAKNNIKFNSLQLKRQVITTVSAVLNLYWDLVSFDDELRIRERALATAQKQYADNQSESRLGTLAAIEVTRAAAAVSASQEDLLIAQTHVDQQEAVLKNALSRTGAENAWLDDVHIVPLDRIEIPKTENLKPITELVQSALSSRPELEQVKVNLESNRVLLKGDKNGLLPTLQAFAELTNNGLSGPVNPLYNNCCGVADPLSVGGYGNLLSVPQPRGTGGLPDRPASTPPKRTAIAEGPQPGSGRREDRGDRVSAIACSL
jgi:outer membrane protein